MIVEINSIKSILYSQCPICKNDVPLYDYSISNIQLFQNKIRLDVDEYIIDIYDNDYVDISYTRNYDSFYSNSIHIFGYSKCIINNDLFILELNHCCYKCGYSRNTQVHIDMKCMKLYRLLLMDETVYFKINNVQYSLQNCYNEEKSYIAMNGRNCLITPLISEDFSNMDSIIDRVKNLVNFA